MDLRIERVVEDGAGPPNGPTHRCSIHFGQGSLLARIERQIAIAVPVFLFHRFDFGLDVLRWREHINLRRPESSSEVGFWKVACGTYRFDRLGHHLA